MIYKKRRTQLLNQLPDGAYAIIATNAAKIRSGDVYYRYRPASDFWYLTGFTEPEAVAIFSKDTYAIFLRDKDPKREIWDGERLGVEDAKQVLKADQTYPISQLKTLLPKLVANASTLYYDFKSCALDDDIIQLLSKYSYQSLNAYVHEMRLIKNAEEIALMQKAADISVGAHTLAMQQTKAGAFEYEIASVFDAYFRGHNSEQAYQSIVAAGKNTCILHYIENNKILKDGDLLLIDAACEVEGYAADITRTFPVNGKFSEPQARVYEIVLRAQKAAIDCIKPGVRIKQMHIIATDVIKNGLIELGILHPDGDVRQFYMHGTGHWLGLDVHDVGRYKENKQSRQFVSGMVTTVEPGIYIRKNDKIDPVYWNIGIRIEDDVLVTKTANRILTNALVKEINDIENIMG